MFDSFGAEIAGCCNGRLLASREFVLSSWHFRAPLLRIADRGPLRVTKGRPDRSVEAGCPFRAIRKAVGVDLTATTVQQTLPQLQVPLRSAFGLSERPPSGQLCEVR